jgi:hypothetical protein
MRASENPDFKYRLRRLSATILFQLGCNADADKQAIHNTDDRNPTDDVDSKKNGNRKLRTTVRCTNLQIKAVAAAMFQQPFDAAHPPRAQLLPKFHARLRHRPFPDRPWRDQAWRRRHAIVHPFPPLTK